MIPDIAILRDRLGKWKLFYSVLALGWTGTEQQQKVLNRAIAIMAVLVIPVAVSVHSVVSFVFSMTLQPMWHSTIFGPYFVVGAIFSGIAALIVAMIVFRKAYGLEHYLKPIHFRYLGQLLLIMSLLWFYFTFAEYLTGYYGAEPEEMKVFWAKFSGPFWPFFWGMVFCNLFVPLVCLVRLGHHTIGKVLTASLSIIVGMWLERFIIVIPSLSIRDYPSRSLLTIRRGWNWENSPAASLCSRCFTYCSPKYFQLFPSGKFVRVVKTGSKKLKNESEATCRMKLKESRRKATKWKISVYLPIDW